MGPTSPSTRRPRACWKAFTASSVPSLKTPSMPWSPRSRPRACRRVWRSTTSRPLSPLRSVRTVVRPPKSLDYEPKSGAPGTSKRPGALWVPAVRPLVLDDPQDVVGVEDHVVLAVQANLGPRVLGEDDDVALADLDV